MNILFFLTPKSNTEFVTDQATLRQTTEKMDVHGYTAIPVIDDEGHYVMTVSEGDILHHIKNEHRFDIEKAEQTTVKEIAIKKEIHAIQINENMESLFGLALHQNFVPVIDDLKRYIGIVKRSDILAYFFKQLELKING